MAHTEYRRIVPGADTAVLFIHGIVGTPDHFRELIPLEQAVPDDWSVCNVLLPGHGGTADYFGSSSMKQWRGYTYAAFEELSRSHRHIFIIAHSMGTLFALQLAIEHPEKIGCLFLLGVPMRPFVRPRMMVDSLRMVFGTLPETHVLWKAGGVSLTRKLWKYLPWIPRFLELFKEIASTERQMHRLTVPCIAWQSRKDELVSNASWKVLERSGVMELRNLEESTHYSYNPSDRKRILEDFAGRLKMISHD